MAARSTLARRVSRVRKALASALQTPSLGAENGLAVPAQTGAGGTPVPNASGTARVRSPNGGQGGEPPSRLDTRGKCSATNAFQSEISNRSGSSRAPKRGKSWAPRHKHGRGKRANWRSWVCAVGRELRSRGESGLADRFELCGASCAVQGCSDCGESVASATVTTSCDLRICPFCARQRARSHVALLSAALLRVPGYVAARVDAHVDELRALLTERERVRDVWTERAARARHRFEHATSAAGRALAARSIERSNRLASAAESERAQTRFDLERAREAQRDGGWSWKLVTVSPRWNPNDEGAYTVEGLRARAADAWERWELVRERYAAGGLAASIAKIEASERGHVHVHALVYGPWIKADSASEIAGCFVDVRSIEATPRARQARDRARATREERLQFSAEKALRDAITEAC